MTKKGRSPKMDAERYDSGRVKPEKIAPNDRVRRAREILGSSFKADINDPFDVVHGMGWVSDAEHRIGVRYAMLNRRVMGRKPAHKSATGHLECERGEVDNTPIGNMTDAERVALWDRVFNDDRPLTEIADGENMAAWRVLDAAMTALERDQVRMVCVDTSWPQWAIWRLHGEIKRDTFARVATAENRAQTEQEIAQVAACFSSTHERKREILLNGLRSMIKATRPEVTVRTTRFTDPGSPVRKVEDIEHRVDEDGELVLEVVRRRKA